MQLSHLLSIAALLLQALPLEAKSPWETGTYVLEGGKLNQGTLTIHTSDTKTAAFSIEVSSCRRDCETDAPMANVGSIDQGTMEISGSAGRYRSAGPDAGTQAPELGICVLQFSSLNRRTIAVTQLSNCWWFGHGVFVSGTYKLEPSRVPGDPPGLPNPSIERTLPGRPVSASHVNRWAAEEK